MSDFNELNQGPKWYVVHTYTGYENKVKAYLEKIIENRRLEDRFFDIKIPTITETVTNDKGVSKIVETKVFPSYVLIKMIMNDETWHVVRGITGVTGFVGPGSKPVPLSDREVAELNVETTEVKMPSFEIGNQVSIVAGSFSGYSGTITEISEDKSIITVLAVAGTRNIPLSVNASEIILKED